MLTRVEIDLRNVPKPPGVPDDLWDDLSMRADLLEDYLHPPQVWAIPCGGNQKVGTPKNHVWQVRLQEFSWIPAEQSGYGYGTWTLGEEMPLTGWIMERDIDKTMNVNGQDFPITKLNSHSVCPTCASE